MSDDYDKRKKNSTRFLVYNKFADFTPNLDSFLLAKRAKCTDFVSNIAVYFGFLVSEKVKTILDQYKLPDHRFYKASVIYKKKKYSNYYFLHIISDFSHFIDYSKTQFYIENFRIERAVSVSSRAELWHIYKTMGNLDDIVLNEYRFHRNFQIEYDMFYASFFDMKMYVSEKLKNALLQAGITGVDFFETQLIKSVAQTTKKIPVHGYQSTESAFVAQEPEQPYFTTKND